MAAAIHSEGRGVFVGRDAELRVLEASLAEAAAGRGGFVGLVGEPGIGKTRTLEELLARSGLAGESVLWGRCSADEGAPAYWPWTQALRGYVERTDAAALRAQLGAGAADVAQLVPAVRERLPDIAAAPRLDPEQSRFRLFDAVATFLQRASADGALLLVLDDLHWADRASILLLGFVAPEMRRSRTLIVGTYRELEMRRLPPPLGEVARAGTRVVLRGLDRRQTEEFIRGTTSIVPGDRLVEHLHGVTEGNPYFLGELLRWLRAEGRLADGNVTTLGLPAEVREAIRRHLEPLAADDRRLLAVAAVVGREFELAPLQLASELPVERLLERLAVAAGTGLVHEMAGGLGCFRFAHALVRETLYEDLPPAARAELHRRVGLALETLYASAHDPPLAELAQHFFHAAPLGDAARAVDYAARAGARAIAQLGYEDAVRHFERALEALGLQPADSARRLELLLALGDAQWRAGDTGQARVTFERAIECARMLGDEKAVARAALGFGRASTERGAVDPALVAMLEEALAGLGAGDSALRAAVMARLAMALYFSRAEERRATLSSEAVEMARRVGDPEALVAALITRHFMLWGPGSIAERLAIVDEAAAIADGLRDRQPAFELQRWRIYNLQEVGDVTAADLELETYARRAAAVRLPTYRWHAMVVQGLQLLLAGRFEEAERHAAEAMATGLEGLTSARGQIYMIQMFVICREQGRLAELEVPITALTRTLPAAPVWRCGLGLLLVELGRTAAARALLAPLAATRLAALPRDGNYIGSLVLLAEIAHALEDGRRAWFLHQQLLPFADRNVVVGPSAACYGSAARYLGLLAATAGRPEEAARHFEDALAMNTGLGARPLVSYTRYDYARLLLARDAPGDRERAAGFLETAAGTAEELGMPRLRARIAALGAVAAPSRAPVPRTEAVLRKQDDGWTVAYAGQSAVIRDMKGLGYLAVLVRHPGREFHALDLGAGADADAPSEAGEAGLTVTDLGDAGEMLDGEARPRTASASRSCGRRPRRRVATTISSARRAPSRRSSSSPTSWRVRSGSTAAAGRRGPSPSARA